jgi:subtilisin family serine protease
MPSFILRLAAIAAVVAPAIFAAPTPSAPHLKIRNPEATDVVPDSYIVVYNSDINATSIETHLSSVSALISRRRDVGGIGATYDLSTLKGYQVTADAATIAEIAASPEVAYIEKDGKVWANALTTQSSSTWGLGRVSHRNQDATSYIYDSTAGSGSTVYVVDTGIYIAHSQFGGRASWGANFISGSANTDENGHGTHCSGTIAGSTYGVAKNANLVAVKVLDSGGSGSTSGVISGIQWVANNAKSQSVLSMSLGGGKSTSLNSAVAAAVTKGVTVVVAAGNDNDDAGNYSPASETTAITVGAIDNNDARASFSNYGSLVDVFGPGVSILSSWIGSTTATNTISGTSMATPHIAGLAAYLITLEGLSTPAAVQARIKALATSGKITDAKSTNNLIGYNGNGA